MLPFMIPDAGEHSIFDMSSNLHRRGRDALPSSTTIAMSSACNYNRVSTSEQNDLSQSSQSSRIVDVPRQDVRSHSRLVIAKIEAIFESMVDVLAEGGGGLSIPYRNRNSPQRPLGMLEFPGRNVMEATKFTQMMRVMELSRDALMSNRLITKRNIYYQDPELFKTQTVVDHLVDDLACTLQTGRNDLNIVAASKGLIAGPLGLIMADGSVLSFASSHDDSDLIPPIGTVHQVDFASTRWILVIEKEACLLSHRLLNSQYLTPVESRLHFEPYRLANIGEAARTGKGKGYADLATLEFLNLIHTMRPLIPLLCVVDCDPHGIEIMRTYKYGSKSLGHEANTRVPGLHWLGVKMDDIFLSTTNKLARALPDSRIRQDSGSQSSQSSLASDLGCSQGSRALAFARSSSKAQRTALDFLIQLTPSDRKTAQRIVRSIAGAEEEDVEMDHEELEQLRELQVMLMLNMKAEIQAIDSMGDLSSWLDEKIGMD